MGQVNDQWLLGKLLDAEGIFPASFVDVVKPPPDNVEVHARVREKPVFSNMYFAVWDAS